LHIGEETSVLLSDKFLSEFNNAQVKIDNITDYFKNISLEELQEIPDVGPKVAQSVYSWFRESRNLKLLEKMEEVGIKIKVEKKSGKTGKLKGFSFVLTGSLETMERGEAKEKIRELGGDVSESVSKKTSYVVVGVEPGSKAEKAKKLGVKIINEKEFLTLIK